jgi:GNAT superfamily N-acetyltransferase
MPRRTPTDSKLIATDASIRIVPANKVSWDDLLAVLGAARCHGAYCYCQRFKIAARAWNYVDDVERAERLREQTGCGHPKARTTSGLVAYLADEPVGWCSVEPRKAYVALMRTRMPWTGRHEDKDDEAVWLAACFIVRNGYRLRGITYALARAAVEFARDRGAVALEGYSMITQPGKEITWGELHCGSDRVFAAAGLNEVSHPSKRRIVMRIDF